MIRPRLPKVASGTRLTTNLVNGIINRTEYAADLLRQYKLVAGTEMYVEPHYDGTRVSYLQQVAGGATPTQPISPAYRIVGSSNAGPYVYDPFRETVEILSAGYNPQGIQGNLISGTINLGFGPGLGNRAFLYDGNTYIQFQHPNADTRNGTLGYKIYDNFICGNYFANNNNNSQGYVLNTNTETFQDFNYGGAYTDTYINGIYENYLCGVSYGPSIQISWFYNGSAFITLQEYPPDNPSLQFVEPFAVREKYVVGYADVLTDSGYQSRGYIYSITDGQLPLKSYPGASLTFFHDVFNNETVVGRAAISGVNRAIQYSISKDQFSLIESPDSSITFSFAFGIG
jgi:hypothetical protein